MRLPPYPSYKPSRVEWVGDVPEHWGTGRLGALFRLKSGGTPSTDVAGFWDGHIPWVSAKDMKSLRIIDAEDHITPQAVVESATSLVPAGTALVVARSGILKHTLPVAVAEREVAINQDIKGCLPDSTRIDSYFFAYWVQGHQAPLLTLWRQQGATVESLDVEKVKTASLPLPPLAEQRTIADFLDRETAKIDTLVAKKRTLIERLKEKRTALILRTVTRGLPPDAARAAGLDPHPRLKPSGVEWLGDVPEHWEVRRLKDAGELWGGAGFPHEFQGVSGEELPFYKVGDLALASDGRTLSDAAHSISRETAAELRARVIPQGAVVYAKIGAALFLNRRRITPAPCCIDNNMTAFIPRASRLTSGWTFYWMSALNFGEFANPGAVPSLSEGYQATLPLLLPELGEQFAIATFLDVATAKIDSMVARVETAIERLQEYRTALITAAVTGKIDVRGAAA